MTRTGSVGPANRQAHRVINTSVLAALTGYPTYACEEFHHALFTLLEDVGDSDGLLAAPLVCVGRAAVFDAAREWLAAIDAHSLALAAAAGSNPSLTLGSIDAISALARIAFDLIARLPESAVITGGASRTTCLTRDTFDGWQS